MATCRITNHRTQSACPGRVVAHGLCMRHYQRVRRNGGVFTDQGIVDALNSAAEPLAAYRARLDVHTLLESIPPGTPLTDDLDAQIDFLVLYATEIAPLILRGRTDGPAPHGTVTRYKAPTPCRCAKCRQGWTVYLRFRRTLRAVREALTPVAA